MFRKKVLDPDQREAELIALIREKAGSELDEPKKGIQSAIWKAAIKNRRAQGETQR